MPITKLNRRRSIVVLLCVILLFGTVFSTTVFADTALISSAPMTSYFETYTISSVHNGFGLWTLEILFSSAYSILIYVRSGRDARSIWFML